MSDQTQPARQGQKEEICGRYVHYKNIPVTVTGVARHSETQEDMVVYHKDETGEVWVRPYDMFFEDVVVDGQSVPRFKKVIG